MSKVFFGAILSQASHQIRSMSVNISRAQNNFLTEKHIDLALQELEKTQKLLQQAKESYTNMKKDKSAISTLSLK